MLDKTHNEALGRTPADHVRSVTLGRIRHCLDSPEGVDVYGDLKGLCSTVSVAYRDRAVLELLQNAHDAHAPERCDGRIRMVLDDDEGEYGALYVANDGRGFVRENFNALCSPTRTTKAVNEAIGNKGVGFLSVFQICAHPEIYSRSEPTKSSMFDGYCFSFADIDRLRDFLVSEDLGDHLDDIIEQMPQLYLAIPASIPPQRVRDLGEEGYATVLRLPIKNQDARLAVEAQLRSLIAGRPEVQLFLDRIADLTVDYAGDAHRLDRTAELLHRDKAFSLERIACGSQSYVLGRQRIPEAVIKAAIEANIAAAALPVAWRSWTGDAIISLAVAASGEPIEGRLYNFLPMDETARSPFAGHLDAPFFASIERKRVESGVAFNDFLLGHCRQLAVRAAEAARICLDDRHARTVVADFLLWEGEGAQEIRDILVEGAAEVIPAERISGQSGWAPLGAVRLWRRNDFFDARRVARIAPFFVVDAGLGEARLARLERFAATTGLLTTSMDEKVELAAAAAAALHAAKRPIAEWNRYYAALHDLLKGHGQALQGRRILLNERGELTEALQATPKGRGRRRLVSIFLPPLRASGVSPVLPGAVQRRIAYLHRELACSVDGTDEGRRFLLMAGLVRDYDRRELLRLMVNVIADPGHAKDPEAVRWEVLAGVKAFCTAGESGMGEASGIGLLVPTREGWSRASEAFFGNWPGTDSSDLDELFEKACPVSLELTEMAGRRLRPYAEWTVGSGDRDGWIAFMRAAGVSDRLRPVAAFAGQSPRATGGALGWTLAARDAAISSEQRDAWRCQLNNQDNLPNPNTPYTIRAAWRLPAQADYDAISTVAAEAYALQLVRMLETDPGLPQMEVFRPLHSGYPNRCFWPSPAGAFLSTVLWLPMVDGTAKLVANAWMPALDGASPPPQAPLVAVRVRRQIDRSDRARSALEALGLSTFGSEGTAWPLIEQAGGWAASSDLPGERLLAITQEAWRQADLNQPPPPGLKLLVRIGGEVTAIYPPDDDRLVYVADAEDRSTAVLLARATPGAVFFEPPLQRSREVGAWLQAHYGEGVQRLSEMSVVHVTPSGDFVFDPTDLLIEQALDIDLRGLVALTVRYRCLFSNISVETALARLGALRVRWLDTLQLRIGDHLQTLPSFRQTAVLARSGEGDTVLAPASARDTDGALLVLAAAIGEGLGSRRNIGDPLFSVAAQLQQVGEGVTASSLAAVFDLAADDVTAMLRDARALLADLRRVARPFLVLWKGLDRAEAVLEGPGLASEGDMLDAIVRAEIPVDASAFLEACRSGSVEAVALHCDVDLAALNEVLADLGAPYRPIDRCAHHEDGFRSYYLRHESAAREAVRATFRPAFQAGDLTAYVVARDRAAPTTPSGIGLTQLRSDASDWKVWLDEWLSEAGVALKGLALATDLDIVRDRNRRTLKSMAARARTLLMARGCDDAIAAFWKDSGTLADRLSATASAGGWMDFDSLDEADVIVWLQRTGLWPAGWPAVLAPEPHGLTEEALTAWDVEERRRRDAAVRPQRVLAFTDGEYVVGETRLADLAEQIASLAESNTSLKASSMRPIRGEPVVLPPRGGGGSGGGGGGGRDRMSDEEKSVIGYFGEAVAFAWLKTKFGAKRVIDEGCWKSEYRRHFCGVGGDDMLGYDFEVLSGRVTWFFEVKATASADPGDLRMVELGSTEIAKAELCRAEKRHHYRILHVVNALRPERAVVRVLPNPRSQDGKAFYTEQKSSGVRLFFPMPR